MTAIATDNRWGRVKWGQTKWGPSALSDTLALGLEVDWNGDGLFEVNEAIRMIGFSGFRGRTSMLQPSGQGFEPIQTGRYTFTLDNWDGRYDPRNVASPLYPNVSHGKDVRFRIRDRSGSAAPYPIFYGILENIESIDNDTPDPKVQLSVVDAWSYVRNTKARVPIQQGITTDTAIGKILDALAWPSRWGRNLDVSSDVLTYFWCLGEQTAGQTVQDLADSGVGIFFLAADGKARYQIRSNVPAAIMDIAQEEVHKDIQTSQPWENFRNAVRLTVNPRLPAASGVIWKRRSPPGATTWVTPTP